MILPHVLDVDLSFTPIHDFLPRKSKSAPFIISDRHGWLSGTSGDSSTIIKRKDNGTGVEELLNQGGGWDYKRTGLGPDYQYYARKDTADGWYTNAGNYQLATIQKVIDAIAGKFD